MRSACHRRPDDVAIDAGALAQSREVDHGTHLRPIPLDFLRAPGLSAFGGLAPHARVGKARQHAVFRRNPPLALPFRAAARLSTEAVHMTRVSPASIRTEPSAWRLKLQ
jgi:hypothetical protein